MFRMEYINRGDLTKEGYSKGGWLIGLDVNTPTAIGDVKAAYALQEKVPTFLVGKPGYFICDCLYNNSEEFKRHAKNLGLGVFNAPLGTIHLACVDPTRVMGVGDGNFVQRADDVTTDTKIEAIIKKLDKLNFLSEINELKYEIVARYWNGQEVSSFRDMIFKEAENKGHSDELEQTLNNTFVSQDNNFYITEYGNELLNQLKDYWDWVRRDIRSYCKTEHVKEKILAQKEFPIKVSLLTVKELPSSIIKRIRPVFESFENENEIEKYDYSGVDFEPLKYRIRLAKGSEDLDRYKNVEEAILKIKGVINSYFWEVRKNVRHLMWKLRDAEDRLKYSNSVWVDGKIKYEINNITKELEVEKEKLNVEERREKYITFEHITSKLDILEKNVDFALTFRLTNIMPILSMYTKKDYIRFVNKSREKFEPISSVDQSFLNWGFIDKGEKFDELMLLDQVCPLGLIEKWNTWKFIYDPLISSATKYYKQPDGTLARVEFNTLKRFCLEGAGRKLVLKKTEAVDLLKKIEDFFPEQIEKTVRSNLWKRLADAKKIEESIVISYKEEPKSLLTELYYPLKLALGQ